MSLGGTPYDEACAQVGTDRYSKAARAECRAYLNQLIRQHGEPPDGASLRIKGQSHDFGTYHEVFVVYDSENQAAVQYAFKVEADLPAEWDDEARAELAKANICTARGCDHEHKMCVERG